MVAVLSMALARADATTVINTLGIIARERGMSQIARETGFARESLYRSLDANGNPEFANTDGAHMRGRLRRIIYGDPVLQQTIRTR